MDADWCGQCLARFTPPPPPDPVPPPAPEAVVAAPQATGDEVVISPEDPLGLGGDVPPVPARAVGTQRGAFTVTPRGVVWACRRCDTENPLDERYCTVCGAPFAETVKEPEPERVRRDPGTTAMISLFMPGAGHAYLGMWGQAVARAVVALWVIAVVIVSALQEEVAGSRPIMVVFAVVAFAQWMVAAHDAYREAEGQPALVILKPRYFLYMVMGLLLLLFSLMMIGFIQAQQRL